MQERREEKRRIRGDRNKSDSGRNRDLDQGGILKNLWKPEKVL